MIDEILEKTLELDLMKENLVFERNLADYEMNLLNNSFLAVEGYYAESDIIPVFENGKSMYQIIKDFFAAIVEKIEEFFKKIKEKISLKIKIHQIKSDLKKVKELLVQNKDFKSTGIKKWFDRKAALKRYDECIDQLFKINEFIYSAKFENERDIENYERKLEAMVSRLEADFGNFSNEEALSLINNVENSYYLKLTEDEVNAFGDNVEHLHKMMNKVSESLEKNAEKLAKDLDNEVEKDSSGGNVTINIENNVVAASSSESEKEEKKNDINDIKEKKTKLNTLRKLASTAANGAGKAARFIINGIIAFISFVLSFFKGLLFGKSKKQLKRDMKRKEERMKEKMNDLKEDMKDKEEALKAKERRLNRDIKRKEERLKEKERELKESTFINDEESERIINEAVEDILSSLNAI